MLIDSHCHLLSSEYDNLSVVIEKSLKYVDKLIINGYDYKTSKEAIEIANKYENIYATVGIGPEEVDTINENDIKKIEKLINNNNKVVGIGEIGLDYYWTKDNKEKQIFVFKNMLSLAKKYNKPVIIHSRESINDVYNLLNEYKLNGIMHCYSGSYEMAKEFIKIGFLIGVGGVVTFKNAKNIKEVVKKIDISSIALETDSPYLSPEPKRGTKNDSSNLLYIVQSISKLKEISTNSVINETGISVSKMFNI